MVRRRIRSESLIVVCVLMLAVAVGCGGTSTTQSTSPQGTTGAGNAPGSTTGTAPGASTVPAAPVASPGCGSSQTGAVDLEKRTMSIDGTERYYLLTTPAAHDGHTPLSLVLDFHGLAEGAEVHSKMSNFGALAQTEGFVVAFPHGQGAPVRWDANAEHVPNADLTYVDSLLERLGADLCLDTSRVYVTGLSYGAIMTTTLLCTRADKFAAAAPVAGLQDPKGCKPKRPVPILTFHGTADPILKWDGGVDITAIGGAKDGAPTSTTTPDLNGKGYASNVAAWAKTNGCDDKATDTKVSETIVHRVYTCPTGADVEFDIIIGGGHAWPGSEFSKGIESVVGFTTFEIDATKEAWAFFQRFHLPS